LALDLSENPLGDDCGRDLAASLTTSPLVKLNLANTGQKDSMGTKIAESLVINQSLQELNLGGNAIGPESARALCAILQGRNKTMQVLDLRDNEVGIEVVEEIEATEVGCTVLLKGNTSVEEPIITLSSPHLKPNPHSQCGTCRSSRHTGRSKRPSKPVTPVFKLIAMASPWLFLVRHGDLVHMRMTMCVLGIQCVQCNTCITGFVISPWVRAGVHRLIRLIKNTGQRQFSSALYSCTATPGAGSPNKL
jgi:hypothetical protein